MKSLMSQSNHFVSVMKVQRVIKLFHLKQRFLDTKMCEGGLEGCQWEIFLKIKFEIV